MALNFKCNLCKEIFKASFWHIFSSEIFICPNCEKARIVSKKTEEELETYFWKEKRKELIGK